MPTLLESLAAELERPRPLTAQVAKHIADTYDVSRENIGAFLSGELPKLEDYEIDLVLSPLFTPTLQDQSVFAELLGRESVPRSDWPALVAQLANRPTTARLVTDDGAVHEVLLRDVTIERFVHRLRLEGTIPEKIFSETEKSVAPSDRALFKAVARRAVWENPSRLEILSRALAVFATAPSDMTALLKLVETYQPAGPGELLALIPNWKQILRQEINSAGAKPFFNERVQDLHGGGRDQRRQDDSRVVGLEREFQFLERLEKIFAGVAATTR